MTTILTPDSATLDQKVSLNELSPNALTLTCYGGFLIVAVAAFAPSAISLIDIWVAAPSYAHGVFAVPLAIGLLVLRRADWPNDAGMRWPGFAALAGAGVLLILGRAAGVSAIEHIAIASIAIAGFAAISGLAAARRHAPSLALFALAPPLGDVLAPPLQAMTVAAVTPMLSLLAVDAVRDANVFTTDAYVFEITKACSGLNIFTASLMTACAMAAVGLDRQRPRAILIAAAGGLAIVANWLRVALVIAAAEVGLISEALLRDHAFAGAVAFAAVVLILVALTVRLHGQSAQSAPAPPSATPAHAQAAADAAAMTTMRRAALAAMACAILIGAYGRIVIDHVPADTHVATPDVSIVGWRLSEPIEPALPIDVALDHFDAVKSQLMTKDGDRATVTVAALRYDRHGHEAAGYDTERALERLSPTPVVRYWLGDTTYRSSIGYRIALMRSRLLGRRLAAGVIVINPIDDAAGLTRDALTRAAVSLQTPTPR